MKKKNIKLMVCRDCHDFQTTTDEFPKIVVEDFKFLHSDCKEVKLVT